MTRLILPLLLSGVVIYGVAVPRYQTPAGAFYNYAANKCSQSTDYWPMIWDNKYTWGRPGPECAGHPLLILNEPELAAQANNTPTEGAELFHDWREWAGPLYCCGNGYDANGYQWFVDFLAVYAAQYGTVPPLHGIHIHAYTLDALDRAQLRKWRQLADQNGWEIVVTETGLFPYGDTSPEDIAAALPEIVGTVVQELRPTHVFWFALTVVPASNDEHFTWTRTALYDDNDTLTPVGEAWQQHTGWQYSPLQ